MKRSQLRPPHSRPVALIATIASSISPVLAQDPPQVEEQVARPPVQIWDRDRLIGSLGDSRTRLSDDHGVTVEPWLVIDYSTVVRGGLDTEGDALRHAFGVDVAWDPEPMLDWRGALLFAQFLTQHGQNGSDETGDFQGVGNWDADGRTQLAELWYRQSLWEDRLWFKIGKIDANADFAYTDFASLFLNGSASTLPTSPLLPTYPDSAFGGEVFIEPSDWLYAGAGVFDGALAEGVTTGSRGPKTLFDDPSDLYLIGEAGLRWTVRDALPGRLAFGGWHATGTFETFDGGRADGQTGAYVMLDQWLWRERPEDEGDEQGLGVFLQYDWADPEVTEVEHHAAGGFTWTGLLPTRDADAAGAMVSTVWFSDDADFADDSETNIEVFYKLQATPWMSIQPDVQYIINPGGTSAARDAVVASCRVEIVF